MKLEYRPVADSSDIKQLAAMADKVWHEYFPCILSDEQIDYMVEKFQSVKALTSQISEGYMYFFLIAGGIPVGYTGVHPEKDRLFLSKLYILKSFRGNHYATDAFDFLRGLAEGMDLESIYLTVNKYNSHSIDVYKHVGFRTVDSTVTDIGNGFVMDDYIMEWKF